MAQAADDSSIKGAGGREGGHYFLLELKRQATYRWGVHLAGYERQRLFSRPPSLEAAEGAEKERTILGVILK